MVILFIILLLILLLLIKHKVSDTGSKLFLYMFVVYWFFSLILSTFSPYHIFKIHWHTYLLLLISVFAFVLGMLSVKIGKASGADSINVINIKVQKLLTSKLLLFLFAGAAFFCLAFTRRALYVAAMQGHAEMIDQYELVFQGNNLAQNVFGLLIVPLFHIMLMLIGYWLSHFKEVGAKSYLQIVVFIFFFICYMLISGGRSVFIVAVLYIISVYILTTPTKALFKVSFKKTIGILAVVATVFVGITAMNNYRTSGNFTLSDNTSGTEDFVVGDFIVNYTEIPLVLFDQALERDYVGHYGGLKLGRATFAGVDYWVAWLFARLGVSYDGTSKIVTDLQETYYEYAPGRSANYAYSGVFFHYLDFDIFGVFLFPFLFGFFFRRLIKRFYNTPKITYLLLICLGFFMMMHSVFTCYFIKGWVIIYIILLLVVSRSETSFISKHHNTLNQI